MINKNRKSYDVGLRAGIPVILGFVPVGIALYAMFIGILTPNLTHNLRLGILAAITAVCNSILNTMMAFQLVTYLIDPNMRGHWCFLC